MDSNMIIGQTYFDRYEILSLLGEGGMSRVYLVKNIKLGNMWAIKEVPRMNIGIEVLAEADILKKLNHSAIPKIIDIEEDESNVYIIEEYIEGDNLKAYKVGQEYIVETQVIDWGLQLSEVIQYLHGQQPSPIIFRDIKPNNIIVTKSKEIKLVDFGIAREFKQGQSKDTMPLGSRGYAAPEQFGGDQSDERTDIFALGVTLYFLVTGQNLGEPPYIVRFDEEIAEQVSGPLKRLIKKCCEPIPENRYQNIAELSQDLKSLQKLHIKDIPSHKTRGIKLKKQVEALNLGNLHKTFNIGVSGVAYGSGSTHTAIIIANALAKFHRVAIVSVDQSNDFSEIYLSLGDTHKKTTHHKMFRYKSVSYFWDINLEDFLASEKYSYDFIVWDYGELLKSSVLKDYAKCDIRLVIAHAMDWKIQELLAFYEEMQDFDRKHEWRYVIPFCESGDLKDIKTYIENPIAALPFHKNPFIVTKEIRKKLRSILTD
ncbi:MAG: serine/threonine-protein kinase [Vallitaleaceae bacterium]|nr:serine/threonine-protein kinase [Vallitaleaceae bacterium]